MSVTDSPQLFSFSQLRLMTFPTPGPAFTRCLVTSVFSVTFIIFKEAVSGCLISTYLELEVKWLHYGKNPTVKAREGS